MKNLIVKAMNVLPSVRYYTNAVIFFDHTGENIMTSTDLKDTFLHHTFGDEDVIVILQASEDKYLSVKNILIAKTSMELRRIYHNGKTNFFFHANPGTQHHSLLVSDLRDCAHLNEYENDQYIADLLQELNAKPENVFIIP